MSKMAIQLEPIINNIRYPLKWSVSLPLEKSDMPLNELLPTVDRLSHQDKLRLIHFLLLAVAKEEGCDLEPSIESESKNALLAQMASTEGLVWSPQSNSFAVQALSNLLVTAKESATAIPNLGSIAS
jgi:hypothetical protein